MEESCRLCGSATETKFTLKVLDKYSVGYMECLHCEAMQTSAPSWLGETYSGQLPNLDVGAARRALRSCAVILLATEILRIPRGSTLMDFGGGDGFVCRLLRDLGFKSFLYDKYASNNYAYGYAADPSQHYDIITCFEVWEHLPMPSQDIAYLFSKSPSLLVVSTDIYEGQGPDWGYLGPDQGGHVFFYSKKAMKYLGQKFGYDVVTRDSTTVFSKAPLKGWQSAALNFALGPLGLLIGRLWMQLIKPQR